MTTQNDMLYLECYSGISGDMFVAALLDLGADEEVLKRALDSLPLSGFHIVISRVLKAGLDACDFAVILDKAHENHDHDMDYLYGAEKHDAPEHTLSGGGHHGHAKEDRHPHAHQHDSDHAHRNMQDVMAILNAAELTDRARALAVRIFTILGEAEARAHGTTLDRVHFHEVGAVDSIVDIVAAAVCLDNLGINKVVIPVLYEGVGHVHCQHGMLPIPVPAVAHIAAQHQLKLHITNYRGEYVTPTGAAIAAAIGTHAALPNEFEVKKIGLGAGKRAQELPGLLRGMLIRPIEQNCAASDHICKLETHIDDCTGEALGYTMTRLFDAGARDVYYTPVYTKKNRPAYLLTVLCDEHMMSTMENIIFAETTTIGIRRIKMERSILKRSIRTVNTSLGDVQVKECGIPTPADTEEGAYRLSIRCYPEHESIAALCKKTGLPYQDVYTRVIQELGSKRRDCQRA